MVVSELSTENRLLKKAPGTFQRDPRCAENGGRGPKVLRVVREAGMSGKGKTHSWVFRPSDHEGVHSFGTSPALPQRNFPVGTASEEKGGVPSLKTSSLATRARSEEETVSRRRSTRRLRSSASFWNPNAPAAVATTARTSPLSPSGRRPFRPSLRSREDVPKTKAEESKSFQHVPGLFRAFRCSSFFSSLRLNTALPYHG